MSPVPHSGDTHLIPSGSTRCDQKGKFWRKYSSNLRRFLNKTTKDRLSINGLSIFFPDYLRYDGAFTDLCACERCQTKFREKYGDKPKLITSEQWYDFKADTIASFAQRYQDTVKSINSDCITGWFPLTGPKKLFSRKRLGQDWNKLSSILDFSVPMIYPYLVGTYDDGWFWGKLAEIASQYLQK